MAKDRLDVDWSNDIDHPLRGANGITHGVKLGLIVWAVIGVLATAAYHYFG